MILSSDSGQLAREFSWWSHWIRKMYVLRDNTWESSWIREVMEYCTFTYVSVHLIYLWSPHPFRRHWQQNKPDLVNAFCSRHDISSMIFVFFWLGAALWFAKRFAGIPMDMGDKYTIIFFSEMNLELEIRGILGFRSDMKHNSCYGFVS